MLKLGVDSLIRLTRQTACSWQQVRGVKRSTYLTGLAVDPDADSTTVNLLHGLLGECKDRLPADSAYRRSVERYCNTFLSVINESGSQEAAEEKLGRQFEEIIVDCQKEFELIDIMAQWKPWEHPSDHVIRVFADVKDIPNNVKQFRAFQAEVASKQ